MTLSCRVALLGLAAFGLGVSAALAEVAVAIQSDCSGGFSGTANEDGIEIRFQACPTGLVNCHTGSPRVTVSH